jgi:hypothetical protein
MGTVRRVLTVCAIGGIAYISFKGALAVLRDVRRYDRIREMSGEGPVARQIPKILREIAAKERGTATEFIRVLAELPHDTARYLRLMAM